MDESLTQPPRVRDEALAGVNRCYEGRVPRFCRGETVPPEKAPANSVPAAAVIRGEQALSGITGRKERVGGKVSQW